jgi:hypothetical protein
VTNLAYIHAAIEKPLYEIALQDEDETDVWTNCGHAIYVSNKSSEHDDADCTSGQVSITNATLYLGNSIFLVETVS